MVLPPVRTRVDEEGAMIWATAVVLIAIAALCLWAAGRG